MTDDSKKDSHQDFDVPELEFGIDETGDLEMEKTTFVMGHTQEDPNSSSIELSFTEECEGLGFGGDQFKEKTQTNIEQVVSLSNFGHDLNIPTDLQEDLESFNATRKNYKLPTKKNETGEIKFEVAEAVKQKPELIAPVVGLKSAPAPIIVENDEVEYSSGNEEDIFEASTAVVPPAPTKIEPVQEIHVANFQAQADLQGDIEMKATMRQMRDEREDLLKQLKDAKNTVRDLEQDNLTLKSALDETKIEVSILRKRHLTELEDIKYRLSMSEDKKMLAEERTKSLALQKEKLEQKVRIDLSQVKQREKELETKLEMLSIDVDSQVQSRDQKILELRRKIDSLEFNMENVSIREQKTSDDKRKIEDKLNKIMKTLRNSIKNLEDDVEEGTTMPTKESLAGKNKE